MIEKERLKELIEQNATIWHNDYGEIKLANSCEIDRYIVCPCCEKRISILEKFIVRLDCDDA